MPEDAKSKARKAARRAQADFEQTSEKLEQRREARKAAFEKARAAGLSTPSVDPAVPGRHGAIPNLSKRPQDECPMSVVGSSLSWPTQGFDVV
jgi:hypothetical protein